MILILDLLLLRNKLIGLCMSTSLVLANIWVHVSKVSILMLGPILVWLVNNPAVSVHLPVQHALNVQQNIILTKKHDTNVNKNAYNVQMVIHAQLANKILIILMANVFVRNNINLLIMYVLVKELSFG